ncbi:MAG: anion permease [Deltaproteobacteria bacterium]|nr:anion permease [Deltaproteobacteria bacterium]
MESLAAVLRRIPLFAELPPGSFARVIADLREEYHEAGTVLCYEGDEARDFYIIKSGEVEVLVNRGGGQRELVAINGANDWFGERALFSDRPRSATVVARTTVALWRLPKEKFDNLVEENPWLIRYFTQVIGDRLYRNNRELSKLQAAFSQQMAALFAAEPPARRGLLVRTAVLSTLDPALVRQLEGGNDVAEELAAIEAAGVWAARHHNGLSFLEAVREFLLDRLEAEVGADGVRALQRQAAAWYERAGRWELAVDQWLAAAEFRAAAVLLARHLDTLFDSGRFDLLQGWVSRLPEPIIAEFLPALLERMNAALRAPAAKPARARWLSAIAASAAWRWVGAAAGLSVGLGLWLAPPLAGLPVPGMHMLALLAWAAVFWAFDVLPDYVVGLVMIIAWILLAVVPSEVALSGFTASPFFIIIGVLGIAASLQSSGLLFRLALHVLRRFPLTYRGQALGLALSGTAISSCIPDVTSGVALAGPIILAQSESLGYGRLSRGSAGLAMAAVLGFGQMSPFFLTGAAENLLAWGLLPEAARAQISWGGWALAALPLALVTFVSGFVATMLFFPAEFPPTVSPGLIETQIEALGRPSRAELVNGAVLLAAMLGWISGPYHGVDAAWVAMSGLAVLLAADLLDRATFRAGIYWDFLFYLGAVLGLTGVVRHVGVDRWIIDLLTPMLAPLAASPGRFLLMMALVIFAARFVLPSFPLVSLLTITVVPIAAGAGIDPLPLVLVLCTAVTVWFLPYQSTYYLALYFSTKEKAFTHGQVRLLAWSYGLIYLLAIAAAIPYWRLLGLLP